MEHSEFIKFQSEIRAQAQQLKMNRQESLIISTVAGLSYKRAASQSPPPVAHPFPDSFPTVDQAQT